MASVNVQGIRISGNNNDNDYNNNNFNNTKRLIISQLTCAGVATLRLNSVVVGPTSELQSLSWLELQARTAVGQGWRTKHETMAADAWRDVTLWQRNSEETNDRHSWTRHRHRALSNLPLPAKTSCGESENHVASVCHLHPVSTKHSIYRILTKIHATQPTASKQKATSEKCVN